MLGKLIKYEFKATARVFLPLYAALLAVSAVTKLMFSLQWQTPQIISMVLSILLMVAAFVMTVILTVQRFYKNLLTDEGYLMFTLPVSTGRMILSKLIVAAVWTVVCSAVVFLSLMIMAFSGSEWQAVVQAIRDIGLPPADLTFFIIEFIALVLTSLLTGILTIYASIALNQLTNTHRVALSFAFYIGLNTVMQILSSLVISLFVLPDAQMRAWIADNTAVTTAKEFFSSGVTATIHAYAGITLLVTVAFGAAMFYTTRYMLRNKLNLQ